MFVAALSRGVDHPARPARTGRPGPVEAPDSAPFRQWRERIHRFSGESSAVGASLAGALSEAL